MRKIFKFIFSIAFSLMIIIGAINFTVGFKELYYFDIDYLNISENTGITEEEIKLNYDYLIDYNLDKKVEEFEMPTIPSSREGAIHFEEVRAIFQGLKNIFYICVIISIVGLFYYIKNNDFEIFKKISKTLIIMPIIMALPLVINFEKSFIIFHEIMFSNDYWIFDPDLDPVINILPEEFFFHSGIMILGIILVSSIILYSISKIKKSK